jgi:hypothetical protein
VLATALTVVILLLASVTHGDSLLPWITLFLDIAIMSPAQALFSVLGWHWEWTQLGRPAVFPWCSTVIVNAMIGAFIGAVVGSVFRAVLRHYERTASYEGSSGKD